MVLTKGTIIRIKAEARDYIESAKKGSYTAEELINAENLMIFGYLRAMNEMNRKKETKTAKENLAIIESHGDLL